ncbi:MAG: hypothetical protein M1161_03375 [Candidatus Thermoplasmatota archaeon]|jgi:hypothetical protein|nr:hypothetical protein [Candidatus Thermoplasmatota archaeon]
MPLIGKLDPEERRRAIEEQGKSWKRWAREDLARYFYMLFCLFVDLMLNLQFDETYSRYGGETNLILVVSAAIALIPIVYIEYLIYKNIFPFQ